MSEQTILYLMGIAGTNFGLNLNRKTLINLTLMIFSEIDTIFLRVAYQGKFTVVFRPGVAGAVKIVTKSGDLVRGRSCHGEGQSSTGLCHLVTSLLSWDFFTISGSQIRTIF